MDEIRLKYGWVRKSAVGIELDLKDQPNFKLGPYTISYDNPNTVYGPYLDCSVACFITTVTKGTAKPRTRARVS